MIPRRFYSLDVSRGLAALAVVFWHWQHFFFQGTRALPFEKGSQPFYTFFQFFYENGGQAVEFFFALSGFVFFWLYSRSIQARLVGAWDFAVLRFSRLYPLHFVTLIFVTFAQWMMRSHYGGDFVFSRNDLFHFFLQLPLASSWGFQKGFSFNGPVWSVSVEILLYVLFFLLCRFGGLRLSQCFFFIFLGFFYSKLNGEVGRGIFSFFIGCSVFVIYSTIVRKGRVKPWAIICALFGLSIWGTVILNSIFHSSSAWWVRSKSLRFIFVDGFLFPCTILALALAETARGTLGKRFAFIGDISYSSYLLHFPLQIIFFMVVLRFGGGSSFFYKPLSLLSFLGVLVPLSMLSYTLFERPVQRVIRKTLSKSDRTDGKDRPPHFIERVV